MLIWGTVYNVSRFATNAAQAIPPFRSPNGMIPALEIPSDINLRLFSSFLSQVGIKHRITDAGVNQIVWVDNEETRDRVIRYYSQMSSGEVVLDLARCGAANSEHQLPLSTGSAASIAADQSARAAGSGRRHGTSSSASSRRPRDPRLSHAATR